MAPLRVGVVGAGIVGLAVARQILLVRPGTELTVMDKETRVATHQTSHNSGVVHAGIYYDPGSLKAALCRRGRELLIQLCEEHAIDYQRLGKLVVARHEGELAALAEIERRAEANGVPVRRLGASAIAEIEPHVRGLAALHSPNTAVVDYVRVAEVLADDIRRLGGRVILATEVTGFGGGGREVRIISSTAELTVDRAVICAGLQSDRVARLAGCGADPAIVPFRGEYYRLVSERQYLVRGLVYPVPDPRYPFLGVHFTRRVDGTVDVGPNAVLALAREGYRWRDVSIADLTGTFAWRGFRKLARHHWRTGIHELHGSLSRRAYLAAARDYIPDLADSDIERAASGVRAQAVAANGSLLDDFAVERVGAVVAVRNAPSPAATSSLAIAEHLSGLVLDTTD
jgi:L-2-hydroxyglutarate oxidase LhgO